MEQRLIPRLDFPRGVLEWFKTQFQTQAAPATFHEKAPGILKMNGLVWSRETPYLLQKGKSQHKQNLFFNT